uniref:Uncharacterized protein n=1 Tax=Daphnia galeata TaxID=27404 RepID=A0A8J2RKS0_9CRUS|nr:unnamed protein product [Daphnia galeata]
MQVTVVTPIKTIAFKSNNRPRTVDELQKTPQPIHHSSPLDSPEQDTFNNNSTVAQILGQDKYCRMIQESLRRQEDISIKLSLLTYFVSKLKIDADETSDKTKKINAIDSLIESFCHFPMNDISDFETFERVKRKV